MEYLPVLGALLHGDEGDLVVPVGVGIHLGPLLAQVVDLLSELESSLEKELACHCRLCFILWVICYFD